MRIAMVLTNLVRNGITKVATNFSRKLVEHGNDCDLLANGEIDEKLCEELRDYGIGVFVLPAKKKFALSYYRALAVVLQQRDYDLVHVHGNSGMVLPDLIVIRAECKAAVVCHCHSSSCDHLMLHKVFRHLVPRMSNFNIACSAVAGEWLFGQHPYTVLPNAFEIQRFKFDRNLRASFRACLDIPDDAVVLGNIARLNPGKNHLFLLNVFERLRNDGIAAKLIIAGDGPERDNICKRIAISPYSQDIILLGNVSCPEKVYDALDLFVFPSRFEGLGIALIEAQYSGLFCFVSNTVPREACISDRYYSLPLDDVSQWTGAIENCLKSREYRSDRGSRLSDARMYDIDAAYDLLLKCYKSAIKDRNEADS